MNKKLKYIVIIFLIFGSENFSNGDSETIDKIQKIVKKKVGNINENVTDALKLLNKYNKDSASAIFDFTIANLYFQQEEISKALNFYNKAIEKFPNFRRAYKNAGLIYVKNSKFKEAIPFLTKTIELGEHSSLIYGLLGYAYGSLDKHLSAESSYRIAIS